MIVNLTPAQARVIGVMLEKEVTTPDQYPLSLNGLTTGCNQKSNREPVMSLSEQEVQVILDELKEKKLINDQAGYGSRVVKYSHRFCNTEFGDLKFTQQQTAIICVLLLRGPQTPGELRTRTNRLAEFNNVDEVEAALNSIKAVNGDPVVIKLEREPGKRESRYMHLFTDISEYKAASVDTSQPATSQESLPNDTISRIESLEEQVEALTKQVASLTEMVEILSE
ncbi:DUF480 domain-containing protein [Alteromonadaceae bacterium M269]|nr:DUF480 domain-containing protein [Alteromonadaceae bacterium M269]